jgi:hypothetical protein
MNGSIKNKVFSFSVNAFVKLVFKSLRMDFFEKNLPIFGEVIVIFCEYAARFIAERRLLPGFPDKMMAGILGFERAV